MDKGGIGGWIWGGGEGTFVHFGAKGTNLKVFQIRI